MRLYNQCNTDSCMPPQEILHSMEDSGINNNLMNVKLDMQRAYDRMRWKFICRVLMKFVFSEKWLAWIEPSISSVTFVVLVTMGKAQSGSLCREVCAREPTVTIHIYYLNGGPNQK